MEGPARYDGAMTLFMEKLLESAIADENVLATSLPRTSFGPRLDPYDGERFPNLFDDVSWSDSRPTPLRTIGDFYAENMEMFDALALRDFQGQDSSSYLPHNRPSSAAWIVGAVLRQKDSTIAELFGISPELESALAFIEPHTDMNLFHVSVMARLGTTPEEVDEATRSLRLGRFPAFNGVVSRLSDGTRVQHVVRVLDVPGRSEAWSYSIQELADAHAAGYIDQDGLWMLAETSNSMSRQEFKECIALLCDGVPLEYAKVAADAH